MDWKLFLFLCRSSENGQVLIISNFLGTSGKSGEGLPGTKCPFYAWDKKYYKVIDLHNSDAKLFEDISVWWGIK